MNLIVFFHLRHLIHQLNLKPRYFLLPLYIYCSRFVTGVGYEGYFKSIYIRSQLNSTGCIYACMP